MNATKLEIMISKKEVVLIEASKLSINDKFMSFDPKTAPETLIEPETLFKERLTEVILNEPKDFYRPVFDPSFDEEENIVYEEGKRPAIGKSFKWWEEKAKEIGGHIATRSEYIAFLGVLLKNLVEDGMPIPIAWSIICSDSSETEGSKQSKSPRHLIEDTGTGKLDCFYDLTNTYKLCKEDEYRETGGFLIAGGLLFGDKTNYPISALGKCYEVDYKHQDAVGEIYFNL